jgi:hypothetical protein
VSSQDSLFDDGSTLAEHGEVLVGPSFNSEVARVDFLAGLLSFWALGRQAATSERGAFREVAVAALERARREAEAS